MLAPAGITSSLIGFQPTISYIFSYLALLRDHFLQLHHRVMNLLACTAINIYFFIIVFRLVQLHQLSEPNS